MDDFSRSGHISWTCRICRTETSLHEVKCDLCGAERYAPDAQHHQDNSNATASEAPTGLRRIVEDAISAATMNKLGLWRCFCQRLAADSYDVGLQIADSLYTELLGRLETSLSKSGGGSGVDISASDDAGFSVPLKYLSLVIDMLHERIVRFEFGNESAEQHGAHPFRTDEQVVTRPPDGSMCRNGTPARQQVFRSRPQGRQ